MKREKKQKPYNPFTTRTIKRATVGRVKCYLRAVKPNPKDAYEKEKEIGMCYSNKGHASTPPSYSGEIYDPAKIYFYEIGANDGSYRKETDRTKALAAFENLVKFEQRQTQIN